MRLLIAVSLVAIACASSAPPMRPGGPSDSQTQEGPVAPASPELTGAAGISRSESGSAPMMSNMQMGGSGGDGNMQHEMGGMQMGGSSDGGMQHDMGGKHQKQGGMKTDGGTGGMGGMGGMQMDGGMR